MGSREETHRSGQSRTAAFTHLRLPPPQLRLRPCRKLIPPSLQPRAQQFSLPTRQEPAPHPPGWPSSMTETAETLSFPVVATTFGSRHSPIQTAIRCLGTLRLMLEFTTRLMLKRRWPLFKQREKT